MEDEFDDLAKKVFLQFMSIRYFADEIGWDTVAEMSFDAAATFLTARNKNRKESGDERGVSDGTDR